MECGLRPTNQEALTIAHKLTNQMFLHFSHPEQLHSDQFERALISAICSVLGIHKTCTTPYHLQSDSLVERFNLILNIYTWQDHLESNASVQTTTCYTLFL